MPLMNFLTPTSRVPQFGETVTLTLKFDTLTLKWHRNTLAKPDQMATYRTFKLLLDMITLRTYAPVACHTLKKLAQESCTTVMLACAFLCKFLAQNRTQLYVYKFAQKT